MNTADRIGAAAALVRLAELIETAEPARYPELVATAARLSPPGPDDGARRSELDRARRLADEVLRPAAAAVLRPVLQSGHPDVTPDRPGASSPAADRRVLSDPAGAPAPRAPTAATGALRGRLTPERSGGMVLLLDAAGRRVAAVDPTPDGSFELSGLAPATYCLVTTAAPPQACWVRVGAGEMLHVALDEPARLHLAPPQTSHHDGRHGPDPRTG